MTMSGAAKHRGLRVAHGQRANEFLASPAGQEDEAEAQVGARIETPRKRRVLTHPKKTCRKTLRVIKRRAHLNQNR